MRWRGGEATNLCDETFIRTGDWLSSQGWKCEIKDKKRGRSGGKRERGKDVKKAAGGNKEQIKVGPPFMALERMI